MIQDRLQERTVETNKVLMDIIGCSSSTYYRLLEQIDYLSSYNHNGKYITLRKTPNFNHYGIWDYNGVRFSKWNTVPETIIQLVNESKMGLAVYELSEIMQLRINTQLKRLHDQGKVVRKRVGNNQIYYSANDLIRHQQLERRRVLIERQQDDSTELEREQLLQIIKVLLEYSKITVEDLYLQLREKGMQIRKRLIRRLYRRFEIEKKGSR